jgi:zinc protease
MNTLIHYRRFFQHFILRGLCFVILPALIACTSGPRPADPAVYGGLGRPEDPVPFMETIRGGRLPSGLRYFILENSRPENRAYLTLAVDAGSVLEEEDERGLAHFVEHMAFNGTERFPEAELLDYLRSLGMRFGAHANAYTSFDETVYGIEVPTEAGAGGEKIIPPRALAVIDDWTRAITFDPKDVDDERRIIVEEHRTRLGAGERVQQKLLPVLFQGSPYADRLPIGLMEIVENAPASRLENFYKKWYRADNMALIFVGDFDGAALEASLGEHFSIPAPEGPLNRPRYDLSPPKKGNFSADIITDPELTSSLVYIYHNRPPEEPRGDLAAYRRLIMDNLIDTMLSLRFTETAADPESPWLYAGSGPARYGNASRYYVLMAQTKTGAVEESLRALFRERESLIRFGFTQGELDLAGRSLLASMEKLVSEKDRQESQRFVGELSSHFLEGEMVPGIEWELEAARLLLPGIGLREISAAAKDYFAADDQRIFITAPDVERESLPDAARVRRIAAETRREKLKPPAAAAPGGELLESPPAPGTVSAERADEPTGALIWELANGVRVILRETNNRNNEVVLYALARGGTLNAPAEQGVSVRLASELFNASGAGPYTRTELVKKLADKQLSLTFWAGEYYRNLYGISTTGDLKTLFELVYLAFTDTRIDPRAAAALLDQYKTNLTQDQEDPEALYYRELIKTVYGNHPRFKPLELEDLPRLNTDEALGFLRRALNPADYTFVLTGNLDLGQIRPLVETYLASIPPGEERLNAWADPEIRRPGKTEREVYKGREEQSQVNLYWFAPSPYSEEAGAAAQALEEYLDIRLTEEIREALGGVYSIGASVSVSSIPRDELIIAVSFPCDPRRAKELSGAVEAALARIAGGDIDAGVFAKAREALLKSLEENVQKNLYLAQSYANSAALLDTPLDRLNRRPGVYRALKPADIQALAARVQGNGPARFILYPGAAE